MEPTINIIQELDNYRLIKNNNILSIQFNNKTIIDFDNCDMFALLYKYNDIYYFIYHKNKKIFIYIIDSINISFIYTIPYNYNGLSKILNNDLIPVNRFILCNNYIENHYEPIVIDVEKIINNEYYIVRIVDSGIYEFSGQYNYDIIKNGYNFDKVKILYFDYEQNYVILLQ